MNELGESFSSFVERKSLENELSVITEIFRDPSLSITTIKSMQLEREESLNLIQLNLSEMNKVKDNLNATNAFKSKLSSLNPGERGPYLVQLNSNLCYIVALEMALVLKTFMQSVLVMQILSQSLKRIKSVRIYLTDESNGKHLNGLVNTDQIFV